MIEPITAIAAALAMGLSAIGAAYAEAHIGAAGMGVLGEDQSAFTKILIYLVIPESIVIFGFVIAAMLIFQ